MEVKCFACDARLQAPNLTALADAFVAHGLDVHAWPFPEASVRNYACNYADAVDRLSDDVTRRDTLGDVTIRPVTRENLADWKRFFDHDGFAGNPEWASCYCLEPHAPSPPEEPERPWRKTRAMMVDRLEHGTTFGYLAYVDGQPAGWVNASLRSDYQVFADVDPEGPEPATVIAISCFLVAPPYRRHGVASALLDRVIDDAAARGATWIEAYPHHEPEAGDPGHFRGTRSMFEPRGFEGVVDHERFGVLRRRVP
jgi:GNAT superfamily N-acetyltransferase